MMYRLFSSSARHLVAPAVAASALLRVQQPTRAEESAQEQPDDPYANLPEEDERTNCTICLVNRQGPCRDLWRKFEYCLKEHPMGDKKDNVDDSKDKTDDSVKCDQYMIAWLPCVQSYKNMYTLYFNDLYQLEFIEPVEKEISMEERYDWSLDVDWTPYLEWLKSQTHSLGHLHLMQTCFHPKRPVYRGEDPKLVEVKVPVKLKQDDLAIEVAYAKDQAGTVLGFEQFSAAKKEDLEGGVLSIAFAPETTGSVQFFALYRGEDEVRLLCSETTSLLQMAQEAGIPP